MNDMQMIFRLLQNAGFRIIGSDGTNIIIEDPTCILRSFVTFAEYAWLVLLGLTGVLLIGWALSMIRGAPNDIIVNMRNLVMIMGVLTAAGPIINVVYGDDLFAHGCDTVQIPISELQKNLELRKETLKKRGGDFFEDLDIYDSGAIYRETSDIAPDDLPDQTKIDLEFDYMPGTGNDDTNTEAPNDPQ